MKNEINQNTVTSANKEYYNEVADDYLKNEYYAYTNEIILDVKKSIDLSIANIKNYDLFLDLGCGSGFLSKIVSEKKIFKQGLGLDISEKQVELYLIFFIFFIKICSSNLIINKYFRGNN